MDMMQLLSDFGFPVAICSILLYAFKKLGEALMDRVVDPVVESHREFLLTMEEQLKLQGGLVKQMVDLQEEILRKLE